MRCSSCHDFTNTDDTVKSIENVPLKFFFRVCGRGWWLAKPRHDARGKSFLFEGFIFYCIGLFAVGLSTNGCHSTGFRSTVKYLLARVPQLVNQPFLQHLFCSEVSTTKCSSLKYNECALRNYYPTNVCWGEFVLHGKHARAPFSCAK